MVQRLDERYPGGSRLDIHSTRRATKGFRNIEQFETMIVSGWAAWTSLSRRSWHALSTRNSEEPKKTPERPDEHSKRS